MVIFTIGYFNQLFNTVENWLITPHRKINHNISSKNLFFLFLSCLRNYDNIEQFAFQFNLNKNVMNNRLMIVLTIVHPILVLNFSIISTKLYISINILFKLRSCQWYHSESDLTQIQDINYFIYNYQLVSCLINK
jgi:hypothetical protein